MGRIRTGFRSRQAVSNTGVNASGRSTYPPTPLRHRYGEVIMPLPVRTSSKPGGGFFVAEKENVCSLKKPVVFSLERV